MYNSAASSANIPCNHTAKDAFAKGLGGLPPGYSGSIKCTGSARQGNSRRVIEEEKLVPSPRQRQSSLNRFYEPGGITSRELH